MAIELPFEPLLEADPARCRRSSFPTVLDNLEESFTVYGRQLGQKPIEEYFSFSENFDLQEPVSISDIYFVYMDARFHQSYNRLGYTREGHAEESEPREELKTFWKDLNRTSPEMGDRHPLHKLRMLLTYRQFTHCIPLDIWQLKPHGLDAWAWRNVAELTRPQYAQGLLVRLLLEMMGPLYENGFDDSGYRLLMGKFKYDSGAGPWLNDDRYIRKSRFTERFVAEANR